MAINYEQERTKTPDRDPRWGRAQVHLLVHQTGFSRRKMFFVLTTTKTGAIERLCSLIRCITLVY